MTYDRYFVEQLCLCTYRLDYSRHGRTLTEQIRTPEGRHLLLLIGEGEGEIGIDELKFPLQRNRLFWIPPNASVRFMASGSVVEYEEVGFYALQTEEKNEPFLAPLSLNHPIIWSPDRVAGLRERLLALTSEPENGAFWHLRTNIAFHELLVLLFKVMLDESKELQEQAIAMTIDYMENNYREGMKREKLARMAGMNMDHYTRVFKRRTGTTPMKYLAGIRVEQAKQELLETGDSLQLIAHRTGFKDENDFIRQFQSITGDSPTAYALRMKHSSKIVSLNHILTGHLLVLGIIPYGAIIDGYYPLEDQLRHTIAVGSFRPDLDKLASIWPDIILASNSFDSETAPKVRLIERIAPMITVPFFLDWREQLRKVAAVTGREKRAARWLEAYDRRAEEIRRLLSSDTRMETVLIVGVGSDKLCMFGRRNVGAVVYGDLKFSPPKGAEELQHYRLIDQEEFFQYDADRIILTGFKNDGSEEALHGIKSMLWRLKEDWRWMSSRAVRNGKVHFLFDQQHLYTMYTSYSHGLLLEKLSVICASKNLT